MTTLLEARGLTADRPGDEGPVRVLDSVDLALESGTLTELVGPSGAGKTTLLLALARLLPDARGSLALDGVPAEEIDIPAWRMRVALLPQRPTMFAGTVAENLRVPWRLGVRSAESPPDDTALREALDRAGLSGVALERGATRLSVGQAARVALLRVLLTRPRVLLLDEPDASLDDASAEQVRRFTAEFVSGGGAAVRVSHARSDDAADRRVRLTGGRLEEVGRA
ncbi:MAG: ATP-binding cassette domain-containing protein [Anaerosomatales bacterium]|nr:ATP-binding cassette domain-containing protein [Anaerosomatales bacterium]